MSTRSLSIPPTYEAITGPIFLPKLHSLAGVLMSPNCRIPKGGCRIYNSTPSLDHEGPYSKLLKRPSPISRVSKRVSKYQDIQVMPHIHGPICMNPLVRYLLPDHCEMNNHLLLGPPKHPSECSHDKRLKALERIHVSVGPLAELLILLLPRPRPARPLEGSLDNVHKARVPQNILVLLIVLEPTTDLCGRLVQEPDEPR